MGEGTSAYKCPNCDTTIRATNIEWYYEEDDEILTHEHETLDNIIHDNYSPTDDREQLYFCPNDECRIVRLLPGDDA